MRVTDTILKNNFLSNLAFAAERLYDKETRVLTNKRINKPSDDPIDTLNSLAIRQRINEVEQFQRNISRTKTFLQNTETIVQELSEIFQRVSTLTVQGASDTTGPTDKLSISYEVDQLLEQVLNASNNKSESIYTFAGTYNNVAPYAAIRNSAGEITQVLSSGTSGDIMSVLGESVRLKSNINGDDLFEKDQNLFNILIKVREDLKENNTDSLREDLNNLSDASEKINNILAVIGSKVNRIEAADSRAENDLINFTGFLSNTEDVDAAEAILDYQTELLTLQSALQAGARLLQPRLGDFLK